MLCNNYNILSLTAYDMSNIIKFHIIGTICNVLFKSGN